MTQKGKWMDGWMDEWLCFLIPPECLESCVSLNTGFHVLLWIFFKVTGTVQNIV